MGDIHNSRVNIGPELDNNGFCFDMANKSFPKKSRKYFQFRHERGVGIPQQQNEQFGRKAEPLIFPVCTDTGCACYSLKSHIRRYNALPLSQKQGRIFFENLPFRYLHFDEEMSVVK